jgi:hypothetical protein
MLMSRTGSANPGIQQSFSSLTSFMDLNGYPTSIQTDPEDGSVTINVRPNICRKFSVFLRVAQDLAGRNGGGDRGRRDRVFGACAVPAEKCRRSKII